MSRPTTQIYGICNTAAFNLHPDGDYTWFATRAARGAALAAKRKAAVSQGLSESASVAGMRPVKGARRDWAGVYLQDTGETIGTHS